MFAKMQEIYKKIRLKLITIVTVILGILTIMQIYGSVTTNRISNDECLWIRKKVSADSVAIIFSNVKVGGVTWVAGIRNGDYLLEINGVRILDEFVAQRMLNKMEEGEIAKYVILKKDGGKQEVQVKIKKLIIYSQFALLLFGFIMFVVGYIVYIAKPDGKQQLLFFKIGFGFAFMYLPNSIGALVGQEFFTLSNPLFLLLVLSWLYITTRLPFNIFHFFAIFPEPLSWATSGRFKKLLQYFWLIFFLINLGQAVYQGYNVIYNKYLLFFNFPAVNILINASYISGLFLLTAKFFTNKDRAKRKPLIGILISYYIGASGFIFAVYLAPIFGDVIYNSPEYYTPIVLMVLLPIAFGYSIFRYNLLDVTLILKTTLVYATATLTLGGVYLASVYFLGQVVGGAFNEQYRTAVSGLTFIFLALLFQPTREKFQAVMTRKFFPYQFEIQQLIVDFNNELPRIVGFNNILDALEDIFKNRLQVDVCGILIRKESNRCIVSRSCGTDDSLVGDIRYHSEYLEKFLEERYTAGEKMIIDQSVAKFVFPNEYNKLKSAGVYSIIPLITNGKVIGFFLFGLSYTGNQFGGKDLELLIALANQASTSLENARLYQAEAEKVKMERDLELARKIQRSLLPQNLPQIGNLQIFGEMIPAMQVGGDYFDVIKVSESKLFVIVGDVSGKGLSASLYMTKIQTLLQMACNEQSTPLGILANLNAQLSKVLDRSSFVTMTIALFNTDDQTVTFARAGHTPMLLMNRESHSLIAGRGLGIGLERGTRFETLIEEQVLPLNSGETFIFYSDGISEALNVKDEFYEEAKLIACIRENYNDSASVITAKILESVEDFRAEADQSDDITLVLVKVN